MSNVRLSNGSPTLERMEARLSDQPKPSACRNLFGPVDHEELKKDFQRQLKAMEDASADAWNFDFSTHTPHTDGRYQWDALDIRSVPGFYSRSVRAKGSDLHMCSSGNNIDKNVDVNGNHDCRVTEQSAETPEKDREQRKRSSCLGLKLIAVGLMTSVLAERKIFLGGETDERMEERVENKTYQL
uniref:Cyclin-dependent kinase inhibitor 1B n=1 Tax=Sinocyclocheilus rhinocerous TaxID=307959 RepID=A0A673LG69_9TELE